MNEVTLGNDAEQALSGARDAEAERERHHCKPIYHRSTTVGGAYVIFTRETDRGKTGGNWRSEGATDNMTTLLNNDNKLWNI